MAESAESAALRAAVAAASLLAVVNAVGDLLGDMPWPEDYEGVHFQYIVNLFDALAFVIGELAAEYVVPETSIASTDRSPIDKMKVRRNSHVRRILRLNALVSDDDTSHLAELVRRYNLGTSRFGPSQQPRFFCCAYELHNRVEQNEGRDVYSLQALAVYEQYLLDKYKYADMQYEFHPGAGTVLVLFRPSTGQYCLYLGREIAR